VLHCLALRISAFFAQPNAIHVFADLPGMRASDGTTLSFINDNTLPTWHCSLQ